MRGCDKTSFEFKKKKKGGVQELHTPQCYVEPGLHTADCWGWMILNGEITGHVLLK